MTRLAFGSFAASGGAGSGNPGVNSDGFTVVGSPTVIASPFASSSSANALECVVSGASDTYVLQAQTITNNRGYYLRARVRISAAPAITTPLLGVGTPAIANVNAISLAVDTSRGIWLWGNGAVRDVVGPTLAVDTDYLLELFVQYNTAGNETVTGRVDGVQFATFIGALTNTIPTVGLFLGVAGTAAMTARYTDWALNDDQGATDNSWPGNAQIAMLLPVSDDAGNSTISADAWRAGNTGTTNLWDAVNNTPPTGTTSPGTTATQIVCDTPSTARNYTTVTETYASKLAAGDTITVVQGVVVHGESVTTGTKTGACTILANPASGASTSFTYGNDQGAVGAFALTQWAIARAPAVSSPTPTRSTGASLRVTADTNTRNVDVCFMGVYVEYIPAAVAAFDPSTARPDAQAAVTFAGYQYGGY